METLLAIQMGKLNRNKELMVFDWDKAASLIKRILLTEVIEVIPCEEKAIENLSRSRNGSN